MSTKALVLSGDGINCEVETKDALSYTGFSPEVVHINELIKSPSQLGKFQLLALPGGFSFGDEIYSGKILALKIKKFLKNEFSQFLKQGKAVIGICNGFQVLTCLNAFTDMENDEQDFALIYNQQGEFLNRWVEIHTTTANTGPWTNMLPEKFHLPIRHGEGNLLVSQRIKKDFNNYCALTYRDDINGSYFKTAGITNLEGNVIGLMPHPEAAMFKSLDPFCNSTEQEFHWGHLLFDNAKNYLQGLEL